MLELDEDELVDVGLIIEGELDKVAVGGIQILVFVLVLCWVVVDTGVEVEEGEEPSLKDQLP